MREHNALEDTLARARQFCELAQDALATFEDGAYKQALTEVLEYSLTRAN